MPADYPEEVADRPGGVLPPQPCRPTVMATRHAVAAGHYLATHAAFEVLEAGGNAVDAGVAAGLALGVLESALVSVAGVAPIMIYLADSREVITISGLGTWPKAASSAYFQEKHGGAIPTGVERTVVPAAPDAWITALERYGTMRFGDVAAAAIRFAREGFPMYPLMAHIIAEAERTYRAWPSNAEIYLPQGRPPQPGEIFVQADLARSLQYMADEEAAHGNDGREAGLKAARDAFYRGDIAATMVKFFTESGGLMTADDLADFRVAIEEPVRSRFGAIDVYACGPWCQGPMLPQILNLLEGLDLAGLGHNSPAYIHAVVEAIKLGAADREAYYGDPRFVDVPIDVLLSKDYAERRRGSIRADRAADGMPEAGDVGRGGEAAPSARTAGPRAVAASETEGALDTSYVSVVDRHGNAFSATPSDSTRSSPVVPGTGLCPSSRGSQSWADPDHPSSIAPGKRPRLTPNPAIAIEDGRMVMPFGTPGGDVQVQAMAQVFLNMFVFGMDPPSAVEAPRFASYSFPSSFEPHAYSPGRLCVESSIGASHGAALTALGHKVEWWEERSWKAGSVCAIRADVKSGVLHAAADLRRMAYALGW